ncbi:NADP-dependent alkenal double bond reductase P1-like [Heracleum sosnowskyi]|uniref:NADP-dependent alkenal double bond reductase P1-like n=1 Tax=Heracleum sosnowskyi TaxID=360622 RepID=A0AAD8IRC5_9APIA|nr:NADP-dependent alkenal double bond reductase P1-like [Heracleum sosnowskyi]
MGSFQGKEKRTNIKRPKDKEVEDLRTKVKLQKEEMKQIMKMREIERQTYEQEKMVFVLKEAEWRTERKRLRDQVQEFSRQLEEKEHKIKGLMIDELVGDKSENDRKILGTSYLMECMREERSRRDEAVDKWKRLYLTIKTELDHVIKMTHQGEERLNWRLGEANLINELYRELEAKEDTIQVLRQQLASTEQEKMRTEREADILKQSLRIMTHRKGKNYAKNPKNKSLARQK